MEKYGKYVRIYSVQEIYSRIHREAEKKLGISGKEAIQIIASGEWEQQKNLEVWLWLKGLVNLLSCPISGRETKDARIRQKSKKAI